MLSTGERQLVAIGNGTASRETDKLAGQLGVTRAVVPEAGLDVLRPYQLFSGTFISTAAATCLATSHDCCGLPSNSFDS
jgi:hypothetical protein